MSDFDMVQALLERRAAGDATPMSQAEAAAYRAVLARAERARANGHDVQMSKYMVSVLRLEGQYV